MNAIPTENGARTGQEQENIQRFGTMPDGSPVERVALRCGRISCGVITYGGALQSLVVPDRAGNPVDVLLGFDTLDGYRGQDKYLGALIGRCANRIGGARFSLGGREYPLAANDGPNHLHGGLVGFDKQIWNIESCAADRVTLSLFSPDGQEGYPGDLSVQVTYRLEEDALHLAYEAVCNRDTLCNLTSHAYFNLSGHCSGPVAAQFIQIPARFYTPADSGSIPTGAVAPVDGTPMDLREGRAIGEQWDDGFAQLRMAGGYDHNWVLDGPDGTLRPCARAWSTETGIALEARTTLPGIQFYSGNYLDGCPRGKGGAPYARRWGFCLETQFFPDSPHQAHFPSALLRAGERYRQETVYRFSTEAG